MEFAEYEYYDYNYSDSNTSYPDYSGQHLICLKEDMRNALHLLLPTVYILLFILGIIANGIVLAVYCWYRKTKWNQTSYLVVCLAVIDGCFAFTLLFWGIASMERGWIFGTVMCKMMTVIEETCVMLSCLILLTIAVERYLCIVKRRTIKLCYLKVVLIGVGLCFALTEISTLYATDVFEHGEFKLCAVILYKESNHVHTVIEICYMLWICLSVTVMLFCYIRIAKVVLLTRNKKKQCKILRSLLLILLFFFLTQVPSKLINFVELLNMKYHFVNTCAASKAMDVLMVGGGICRSMFCCINPLLYAFAGGPCSEFLLLMKRLIISCMMRKKYNIQIYEEDEDGTEVNRDIAMNSLGDEPPPLDWDDIRENNSETEQMLYPF